MNNETGLEPVRMSFEVKGNDAELQYMAMLLDVRDCYLNALDADEMKRAHDWFNSFTNNH